MHIHALPAFEDNYIWLIANQQHCIVVDPGEAQVVVDYLEQHQLNLCAILVTHHHYDHTGGVAQLQNLTDCDVYGPGRENIDGVTHVVNDGDKVHIQQLDLVFDVFACPGHTLDHIAFYTKPWLFCGDTLFSAGCGRMFEGKPKQFLHSLKYLSALPDNTEVYCAHEYTEANLRFAATVEPDNERIATHQKWAAVQRNRGASTLPSQLALERAINPFLRCHTQSVKDAAQQRARTSLNDESEVFACIRHWKDTF